MLYFANPSTQAVRDAMSLGELGCIVTPAQGNRIPPGAVVCADNGKFGDGWPGRDAYLRWLSGLQPFAAQVLFAVVPDVPGDMGATLTEFASYLPHVRALGFRVALAFQNGAERAELPWQDFEVVFLGGLPECIPCGYVRPPDDRKRKACPLCGRRLAEWKLSAAAAALGAEGKRRGKWVHMGRVNSEKRLVHASFRGWDSADGTCVARAPDKYLSEARGWMRKVNQQGVLWTE